MVLEVDVCVFDQGNCLLLNPFPATLEIVKPFLYEIIRHDSPRTTAEQIIAAWTEVDNTFNYPFCGHFTQERPLIEKAFEGLGISDPSSEFVNDFLTIYRTGLGRVIKEDPRTQEVRKTLHALKVKGKGLGVFSDDRTNGLNLVLNWMGIKDFFEYVMASEELQIEKPDERVFEHIANHFSDVPRDRIVYVGDDPARDIVPAKAAGMKAIHYVLPKDYETSWRDYSAQVELDARVREFSELLDVIR